MSDLRAVNSVAAEVLSAQATSWALVGGLAVSVRTEPRFTRDVDLAVAVQDDDAAEATAHRLLDAAEPLIILPELPRPTPVARTGHLTR